MGKLYPFSIAIAMMTIVVPATAQQSPTTSQLIFPQDNQQPLTLHAGDSFSIRTSSYGQPKRRVLATALKGVGVAALAYSAQHTLTASGKDKAATVGKSPLIPALGTGLLLSSGRIARIGRGSGTWLSYEFYDRQNVLVSRGFLHLQKKQVVLSGKAPADGYLKVDISDGKGNPLDNAAIQLDVTPADAEPLTKRASILSATSLSTVPDIGAADAKVHPLTITAPVFTTPSPETPSTPLKRKADLQHTRVNFSLVSMRPRVSSPAEGVSRLPDQSSEGIQSSQGPKEQKPATPIIPQPFDIIDDKEEREFFVQPQPDGLPPPDCDDSGDFGADDVADGGGAGADTGGDGTGGDGTGADTGGDGTGADTGAGEGTGTDGADTLGDTDGTDAVGTDGTAGGSPDGDPGFYVQDPTTGATDTDWDDLPAVTVTATLPSNNTLQLYSLYWLMGGDPNFINEWTTDPNAGTDGGPTAADTVTMVPPGTRKGHDPNWHAGQTSAVGTAKYNATIFNGFNVSIPYNTTPALTVGTITADLYGFTPGNSWTTGSIPTPTITGNVINFTLSGILSYNVFVQGVGTILRVPTLITGTYDTSTGNYTINVKNQ